MSLVKIGMAGKEAGVEGGQEKQNFEIEKAFPILRLDLWEIGASQAGF